MVHYTVYRKKRARTFKAETTVAAARAMVGQLDSDQSFPFRIKDERGSVIWAFDEEGSIELQLKALRRLARGSGTP